MNAPILWLGLPLVAACVVWMLHREQWVAIAGGSVALLLCLIAIAVPIDSAVNLGGLSIRIDSTLDVFGRQLKLSAANQPLLIIIYGTVAFWLFGAAAAGVARRVVPLGLVITSLLMASLAVEPFLYASLLIELAVLIAVPLLAPPNRIPGRGVIRFLVFQTLAMPFILMAGFLLAGVESTPGDLALVVQAATLLGLGFAFLLAIFPFYTWMPMICEEANPYAVGFVLALFPLVGILFGLGFLDRYTWLRSSPLLGVILRSGGLLMVVTGGIWAAFQRHIGRMMGYAVIMQMGFTLLALSLPNAASGLGLVFMLIIPRTLALGLWSLGTTLLKRETPSLVFSELVGQMRTHPLASTGVVLSALSMSGMVLLAGFPAQQSIWEQASAAFLGDTLWIGIGIAGLFIGGIRTLATLVMSPANTVWASHETWAERFFLGLGMLGLFVIGIFPQWVQPLLVNLPKMFNLLGR